MALAITEEHRALAEAVERFTAEREVRRLTRRAFDDTSVSDSMWTEIATLGWASLHLPEDLGGSGFGLPEAAVVLERLGAEVAPGRALAATIASAVLHAIAPADPKLPAMATGESAGAVDLSGELLGGSRLNGASGPVLGAEWASVLIARSGDDLAVFAADAPGVTLSPARDVDPALGLARVHCVDVEATVVQGAARIAVRIARALAAAEAAGGAQATLAMARSYAAVREQFGRPIGSFQAIKHHLANMLVEAERATAVAWDAARMALEDDGPGDLATGVAAAVALDAYRRNAQANIQIHGGIGFTWEHDAHLYLRRALALTALFGSVERAQDEVVGLCEQGVTRGYAVELPPEAEEFRAQAREFARRYDTTPADQRRTLLVDCGYLVPHWPKPWGRAAGPIEQLVMEEELGSLDIPQLSIGGWVMMTITQFATPEQTARWVDPGLRGELVWCQLFSEPNAGSDAAAVQTKAVRVDGGWLISGQKVWTSEAQHCNRGLATVRTDPSAAKHQGITAVVIDLTAEGVEIRPLRELTGGALFNEVFFNDVFIADGDVVGEVNGGWAVARATLGNERVTIGGSRREGLGASDLLALVAAHAPADQAFRREIGRIAADEQVLRLLDLRRVAKAVAGSDAGAEGSVTKLQVAEYVQRVTELAMRIVGTAALDGSEREVLQQYLFGRASSIAGGTSEISRNVIAERLLGLPREAVGEPRRSS